MVNPINRRDRQILRDLAARQAELSASDQNRERQHLWTRLKDLDPVRPMILLEIWPINQIIRPDELVCTSDQARSIERGLRLSLIHFLELEDDYVLPDTWHISWIVTSGAYGHGLEIERMTSQTPDSIGYVFKHPIKSAEQLGFLQRRTHLVDQAATLARRDLVLDVFGDLLPVELSGGLYHIGTTGELFKLIGHENLMYWCYDEPEAIQFLMNYLYQDRLDYLMMLQNAGLLTSNIHNSFVASGSPGYTSSLPDRGKAVATTLNKVWAWTEAQETEGISPDLFQALFLPAMARLARQTGLVYYGCCERLDDRIDQILSAIPNIRAVSCSPWSQVDRLAEQLGSQVVLSKKPNASFISGSTEDVSAVATEMKAVAAAINRHHCPLEVILRDLYDIQGDRNKLRRWVNIVRTVLVD